MPDGPCALTVTTLLIAAATPDQIRAIRAAARKDPRMIPARPVDQLAAVVAAQIGA